MLNFFFAFESGRSAASYNPEGTTSRFCSRNWDRSETLENQQAGLNPPSIIPQQLQVCFATLMNFLLWMSKILHKFLHQEVFLQITTPALEYMYIDVVCVLSFLVWILCTNKFWREVDCRPVLGSIQHSKDRFWLILSSYEVVIWSFRAMLRRFHFLKHLTIMSWSFVHMS